MQFFLRILMLLIFIWGGAIYLTRPHEPHQSRWYTYTQCETRQACWLGITPARTRREQAFVQLYTVPDDPVYVDLSESGQSIQWRQAEGYQGFMVFNQTIITSLEIQFSTNIAPENTIYLGDVILRYGIPDAIARFPDETTQLYYYDRLLSVRIDTTNAQSLAPNQHVLSAQFFSPYGQGIPRPRGLIQSYAWRGFTQLPAVPPWGP